MHSTNSIVFIVNSDVILRSALERAVRAGGFNVVAFGSVAAYRAYLKPDLPACHVLDASLPDMSGLALQASLASSDAAAVVFVARKADIASSARAFKAGAVDFLAAPVVDADLLRAIASALRQAEEQRARSQRMMTLQLRWDQLTAREREVLMLVVSGCLNKQVASELGISEITVKAHRGRVMAKMLADSFADLVRMAAELKLPLIAARHVARYAEIRRQETAVAYA
jgi:FixJ family two-component response regulator